MPFRDLGVDEVICAALDDAGIHATFPIQALTLPLAIDGQDIIGQARTGTGKTLMTVNEVYRLMKSGVDSSSLGNPAVENCIVARVYQWQFPKPKGGGIVQVSYPFLLKESGIILSSYHNIVWPFMVSISKLGIIDKVLIKAGSKGKLAAGED